MLVRHPAIPALLRGAAALVEEALSCAGTPDVREQLEELHRAVLTLSSSLGAHEVGQRDDD